MKAFIPKKILVALLLLVGVLITGTAGYVLIEKWNPFDALYMTVITLTTVGYGETHPLTQDGRVFTIILLLSGFGIITYGFTAVISFFLEGELNDIMRRRKMDKQIEDMRNHHIVCATGETGEYVIEEFLKTKQPAIVVTLDPHLAQRTQKLEIPTILDNPAEDPVLKRAGIEHAKGLISVLGADKDNLFVVLSARGLNPTVRIVTQAIERSTVVKLKKAGADEVVLTDFIGGMRIASAMLRPHVVSFLDTMLRDAGGALRVAEATIAANSLFDNKPLSHCNISDKLGCVLVAVKNAQSGEYIHNPAPTYKLAAGDTLIVIGYPDQVNKLSQHASA